MSDIDRVQYAKDGDVAVIALNQPETLNALSFEVGKALMAALDTASGEARAILLTSRGRAFSSGANLADGNMNMASPDRDVGEQLDTLFNPMIRQIRDLPVPIVTAVRGPAAGVACAIALMGDIIVAGESAYFLQAFCNIGLVPDGGSPYILAKAAGRVRAMEMMMLGEKYPAERAYADGLVTRVVKDEALDETALDFARRLAAGPTKALGLIRRMGWAALDSSLDEQLTRERYLQREAGRTRDFIEGVVAFREKRKPDFTGE